MTHTTVAIFGVFDGIHEGHREFIRQAKSHGQELVAIVARDSIVEKLKNKMPINREANRIESLLEVPEIDRVYLGDAEEGTYKILKEINPDCVYLGYDQEALSASIKKAIKAGHLTKIDIVLGQPYKPEIFKSSILNK